MSTESITAAQIKMLFTMARKAGIDSDTLHAFIMNLARKESVKELTKHEAIRVINHLKQKTGEAGEEPGDRANNGQLRIIYGLARKLGWMEDGTNTRLLAFCEKRYGVSHPRFLDATQTNNVILALRGMVKGNRGERYASKS